MAEIILLFKTKRPNEETFHILKSLTYFGDADPEPDPKMRIKASWSKVKKTITEKTQAYLRAR